MIEAKGEYPQLSKLFTALASGFDTFQIPYFKIYTHPIIAFSHYYNKYLLDAQ
jgi:hypothetical protein